MEVQIGAKDFKVSPDLREFIQERVSKLDRFVGRVTEAKLELTHERPRSGGERHTAQLTIATGRAVLRAEEQHAEVRRAIDLAVDKMGRRIKRYHSKRADHGKQPSLTEVAAPPAPADDLVDRDAGGGEGADEDAPRDVVRTKRFPLKPMSSAEAIEQMELLGHDFFMFLNADEDQVNVLYRREGGGYGLLQPA